MQRATFQYLSLRHGYLPLRIRSFSKPFLFSIRLESTKPAANSPPTAPLTSQAPVPPTEAVSKSPQRFEKILNKTPKFLRKWIQPIANKPLSHITAFLILHEVYPTSSEQLNSQITAIVPLVGLTYIFHKAQWTPPLLPGEWVVQGVEKGAKLIRHYGLNVKGDNFLRLAFKFAAAYATVKVSIL